MAVSCFLLTPTGRARVSLRRYRSSAHKCSGPHGYHDARVDVGDFPAARTPTGILHLVDPQLETLERWAGDARWPTACACGEPFGPADAIQVFVDEVYRRSDTGADLLLRDAPPGAMWDAPWMGRRGPDGLSLFVVLPDGHQWWIDGRAGNCTLKDDDVHRCWVRTGVPPLITVGKTAPGQTTCSAGAGSIATDSWHGFLRAGQLVL